MSKISSSQKRYLIQAKRLDPEDVFEFFYSRLKRIANTESLDPEWKVIWENNKDFIYHLYHDDMIQEIEDLLSVISVVDPEIETIKLKSTDNICLLLGAGASVASPSNIPAVANLLPELWRRAGKIGSDEIDRLTDWCTNNNVSNIEDLLTAAYLANFAAKNSSVTGLLDYFMFKENRTKNLSFRERSIIGRRDIISGINASSITLLQDTLQVLFGLLTGAMIPAQPNKGHDAIVEFVNKHDRSSIITTNYDACIDEALIKSDINLNTYLDKEPSQKTKSTDLIKIHGSINWSYCESCHQVKEYSLLNMKKAFEQDTLSYAVIGICKNCGGQRRPLLIPPMGLKFIVFPNLIQLWNAARERLETAEYIFVVGFSFSDADLYLNRIIERSMSQTTSQKLIVCDPNTKIVDNLRSKYSARIDNFDNRRILKIQGGSEEFLPKILAQMIDAPKSKSKTSTRTK